MFTKNRVKIGIAVGLVAVVLLAGTIVYYPIGFARRSEAANNLAGSDWIERHPSVRRQKVYAGSNWIERYLGRNIYAGSDYIERHPSTVSSVNYSGSDWIERHPSKVSFDKYAGSDWIERHPNK